jgi:hypothetical protein
MSTPRPEVVTTLAETVGLARHQVRVLDLGLEGEPSYCLEYRRGKRAWVRSDARHAYFSDAVVAAVVFFAHLCAPHTPLVRSHRPLPLRPAA